MATRRTPKVSQWQFSRKEIVKVDNTALRELTIIPYTDRFEETLHVRSGAIQAALNLDFSGTGDYNALGIFFGKISDLAKSKHCLSIVPTGS
jgi:hypothetical protein